MSALSARNDNLYSERDVNMRYGSSTPFVIRSSMSTPMYASARDKIKGGFFRTERAALIPAIIP
jgi:hypothetical protein